jgi:hypothetical protein
MHALKGLSQLGIGSPTNKDIKGKKLTPSGGVRVTGPGESGETAVRLAYETSFPKRWTSAYALVGPTIKSEM